ncbi:hypothetical protein HRO26_04950 [Treponema pectinovorum]|uniref:shikimate kinase n=1 Tax=Treponema pectinovorum TaxID=164 RepID=UPI003D8F9865
MTKAIILMGVKHCGKSTQARLVANYFSVPWFDSDDVIFEKTGMSAREIYSYRGKDTFLEAEKDACLALKDIEKTLANNSDFSCVIATGGGICNNNAALGILKSFGILVFLNAEEKIACSRITREVKKNPDGSLSNLPAYIAKENPQTLEDVRAIFHNFFVERQKLYESVCDVKINLSAGSKTENRDLIISALKKIS